MTWTYYLVYVLCLYITDALVIRQLSGHGGNTDQQNTTVAVFRLPGTTVPNHYDLRFEFQDFNGTDNSTFSGVASINITVVSNTDVVTLNLRELNVNAVMVTDITMERRPLELKVKSWLYLVNDEQFEIYLDKTVSSKSYLRVSIAYDGNIRTDMTGLYLGSYEEQGTTK